MTNFSLSFLNLQIYFIPFLYPYLLWQWVLYPVILYPKELIPSHLYLSRTSNDCSHWYASYSNRSKLSLLFIITTNTYKYNYDEAKNYSCYHMGLVWIIYKSLHIHHLEFCISSVSLACLLFIMLSRSRGVLNSFHVNIFIITSGVIYLKIVGEGFINNLLFKLIFSLFYYNHLNSIIHELQLAYNDWA